VRIPLTLAAPASLRALCLSATSSYGTPFRSTASKRSPPRMEGLGAYLVPCSFMASFDWNLPTTLR